MRVGSARASPKPSAGCAPTSRTTQPEPSPPRRRAGRDDERRSGRNGRRGAAGSVPDMTTSFWHPFADMGAVASNGATVLERGEGAYVWDADGRRYLDATASLWYCNVGWGRSEIADAVAAQLAALPAYSTFGDLS